MSKYKRLFLLINCRVCMCGSFRVLKFVFGREMQVWGRQVNRGAKRGRSRRKQSREGETKVRGNALVNIIAWIRSWRRAGTLKALPKPRGALPSGWIERERNEKKIRR